MKFLCGCSSKIEFPIPDRRILATFDSVSLDEEGFLICAIHRCRRYGWRAPNHTSKFASHSDIEYERAIVWGLPRWNPTPEIHVSVQRDLRPHIYEGMLDEKARLVLSRIASGEHVRRPTEQELLAALDEISAEGSNASG